MEVKYSKKFLKDLASLPSKYRLKIDHYVFEILPGMENFNDLYGVEKLKGYKHFFKKRFGKYRVGMRFEDNALYLERVLHRKDIYKYYP